ncbi:MAG: DNA helicase RecQ, partial [Oscillospiraceae bacterium]|nr:DNA helicase RecQ [Oscillospiraceae bacterium]
MNKYEILKQYFGYDRFRNGQEPLIDSVMSGRDTLGVMPTGAGKSICYQVPALAADGMTIVISPLISLMQDQVRSLVDLGIRAAYINSSLTMQQIYTVIRNCANNVYKIVYVAPERLSNEVFLDMCMNADIKLFCVDEAHCISQWGQDFRPSYLEIPEFIGKLPYRPTVAAFTATATEQVRQDIKRLLGLRSPFELVTGFDRENLYFEVRRPKDKAHDLLSLVEDYNRQGRSGIVYCATRKDVESTCEMLREKGIPCARYHAGLSDTERKENQDAFIYDRVRVITATNAFGMGIDKSNVTFVIHYNMPKDIESYYQEAGRAGRDGSFSECILMANGRDISIAKFLIEKSFEDSQLPPEQALIIKQRDLRRLDRMVDYARQTTCLRSYMLRYFGEDSAPRCDNCSYCLSGAESTDVTVDMQKIMSCIYRSGEMYGKLMISRILRADNSDERITGRGLDKLTTYGIMKDDSDDYIGFLCSALIAQGFVRVIEDTGSLKLTPKALPVLKGEQRISLRLPEKTRPARKRKTLSGAEPDTELFGILRALRQKLALAQSVPAYVVFTDAVLSEMSAAKPVTKRDFLNIPGIAQTKYERYGERFISEIKAYLGKTGTDEKQESAPEVSQLSSISDVADAMNKIGDIQLSDDPVSVTDLLDRLNDAAKEKLSADIKLNTVRTYIFDTLVEQGYIRNISTDDGKKKRDITENSSDVGIISQQKIGKGGIPYTAVLFDRNGQKYVLEMLKRG